jgi:UDP-2,4-diacetamido-2,4,6-trideoxy-beta-L-altropyranose hydrolase
VAGAPPRVLVRTDASVAIGMGHAMRCLALTQALVDARGGRALYLMSGAPPAFERRAKADRTVILPLHAAPGTHEDADETVAVARRERADWVVLDAYHFDGDYQLWLVEAGLCVLAFDDFQHAEHYPAHLILNQNFGARADRYVERAPHTRLLLGPRYVQLRRDFRALEVPARDVPERARRVLVTFGGSDPENVSTRVVRALNEVDGPLDVQVLVGGANPHRAALEDAASGSPHEVTLVTDATDMPARMLWADLAVAASGGTVWELMRVGTPQVGIVIADNQLLAGQALNDAGLVVGLGWHAAVSEAEIGAAVAALAEDRARRAELSARGQELIDGCGASRVLEAMGLAAVPSAA